MVDVTIRGAGILGLSLAWVLTQRGAKVKVIDPNGVAAGASGGIVGALAPHTPENWNDKKQFQLESLLMAEKFWEDVDACSGQSSGYARLGRIQPILEERHIELAHQRSDNAKTLWLGQANWRVLGVADMGDWMTPSPTGYWIFDTLTGRINPKAACLSLASALTKSGVNITEDGPDQGRCLWATGVHDIDRISANRPRQFGNGVKGQAALFQLDVRDQPQLFADTLHIIPHENGTVAVGSTSERFYEDPTSTDDQLDDIIERARAFLPSLQSAPLLMRWAGVRPRSRSRAPVIGQHPLDPDAYILNGGFKIGLGMAPKMAHVLADLVLEGRDEIPESFRPEASF